MKKYKFENFDELLRQYCHDVIRIKNRLFFLRSFEAELTRCCPENYFEIKDDQAYSLVVDSLEMTIIDLCSLIEGMRMKNGFFDLIKKNFISEINCVIQDNLKDMEYSPLVRRRFEDLFGDDSYFVNKKGVEAISLELKTLSQSLVDDRNEYRAHKYEKKKIRVSVVEVMNLDSLSTHFSRVENLLNDFFGIYHKGSCYSFGNEVVWRSSSESVKDLVDCILHGGTLYSLEMFGLVDCNGKCVSTDYYWKERENFYKKKKMIVQIIQVIKSEN